MKTKYIYHVTEQSVDVRNFEIETDKPFTDNDDDGQGYILDAICEVSITKEGDTETGTTDDGVNYKVTYVDTDYGGDSQTEWDMSTL
tara:strand:+ start:89 stop:349 length:261 start_codon:yes stop_codon:yes gene_type:complete